VRGMLSLNDIVTHVGADPFRELESMHRVRA